MSTVGSTLSFMVTFKSGPVTVFPLKENAHWTYLLGFTFRPFCPDHSETYLRAYLIMKRPWASLQGLPMTASAAYLRKEANDSEAKSEV